MPTSTLSSMTGAVMTALDVDIWTWASKIQHKLFYPGNAGTSFGYSTTVAIHWNKTSSYNRHWKGLHNHSNNSRDIGLFHAKNPQTWKLAIGHIHAYI